ncbi:MAG: hypothetical protein R3F37_01675 [Candidatus Competibacteraceae bacterium]
MGSQYRASGIVQFRNNLVYAFVDSDDEVIDELDESNNLRHSGQSSLYQPPVGDFQPVVEWQWNDEVFNAYGVRRFTGSFTIDRHQRRRGHRRTRCSGGDPSYGI